MKTVLLDFCDMWDGFSKEDNWFVNTLRGNFPVEISDRPDFLIFGQPGKQHRRYHCTKIYFGVESFDPDWRICDYAMTCNHIDDERHFRLPLYVLYASAEALLHARRTARLALPSKFCSFVVSNAGKRKTRRRIDFFSLLDKRERVDSGGRYLNNIGGALPGGSAEKIRFLSEYKFNIAFENESKPGYTTEKIVEAFLAGTVPVYWGNLLINGEFNPGSFVNAHDFADDEALVDHLLRLHRDDALYRSIATQPPLTDRQSRKFFDMDAFNAFFEGVFSRPSPGAKSRFAWLPWG